MNNSKLFPTRVAAFAFAFALLLAAYLTPTAGAASWNNIEPLKSRRADVERVLGKPLEDKPGETGTLHFKVAGGQVTVSFVTARFVETKKLAPELEGTVLQVVLKHENAPDTPATLNIDGNSNFQREERDGVAHYRNQKDGISYTFVGGKLKTTWFSPAAEELVRAQVKR
ncbi:MAG TPA: hypothetical protein VGV38_11255 [Pyrinomonadaceae bacterium]|nr:hypothetical protein [Pyrinomonadaceae bacterium]